VSGPSVARIRDGSWMGFAYCDFTQRMSVAGMEPAPAFVRAAIAQGGSGAGRENDPKSLLAVLYVQSFRFLNLFVRWDKLPTFLAVTNLGALREVLRAKNLHNTSDIPVTELKGLRVASSRVQSRPSFQCRRRPSSNWPSTSRPPAHSA